MDGLLVDAYQSLNANVITSEAFSNYPSVISATGTSQITDASARLFTSLPGILGQ